MTLCILDDMIDVAAAAETYSIRINFTPEPFRFFFARPHLCRRVFREPVLRCAPQ